MEVTGDEVGRRIQPLETRSRDVCCEGKGDYSDDICHRLVTARLVVSQGRLPFIPLQ